MTFKASGMIGDDMDDLYDFPRDHTGRKRFVSVRGHSRSIPAFKTYKGVDGYNYLRPEYGGSADGVGGTSAYLMGDKPGYVSPMDGNFIEGRSAHRDHMARHNVVEAGDMKPGHSRGANRAATGGAHRDIVRAMQGHRT